MQCYDAFSFVQPEINSSNDDDDLQYSSTFVAILTVCLCVFTLGLGFALGYFYLKYKLVQNVSDLSKPLLSVLDSHGNQPDSANLI